MRDDLLTIDDLAAAKGIPAAFIAELGVAPSNSGVAISYGPGHRTRIRTSARSGDGFRWIGSKLPIVPYGVHKNQIAKAIEQGRLLLVEGESDCWTAWFHDLAALGIPGATMTKCLELEHVALVQRVYAIQEPDGGGQVFVDGVATRMAALRQEHIENHGSDDGFPTLYIVRFSDGVKDLNELHLQHLDDAEAFVAAVDAALVGAEEIPVASIPVVVSANSANSATDEWTQPLPLRHFDPPPFPVHVLPDWLRDYVEAEAVATQTPPDLTGMLVLGAIAACVARHVEIVIKDDWSEPLNCYFVAVLDSGTRKSSVFRGVVAPIAAEQRRRIAAGRDDWVQAKEQKTIAEKRLTAERAKAIKGEAKDADVIALAEEVDAINIPGVPRLLADDATAEALERLLAENGGKIAIFTAEGDIFDLMQGRYSSSGIMNIGVFLRAHAGDDINTDRIGRGHTFVERPALTLALAVQPEVIYGLAAKREFRGRGLTPRFLYSIPASNIGRRDVDSEPMPKAIRRSYEDHISALLATSNVTGQDQPHVLHMNKKGRSVLLSFAEEIEPELPPGGLLGDITEWGSKLVGATARIAALLHAADHAKDTRWWNSPVSAPTVERAIEVARYLIPHARAAFALMGTDLAVADAEHILQWIKKQSTTTFTVRDVFEGTKGRFKKVSALAPGLALLEEHDHIRLQPAPEKRGPGRPASPTFDVNPYSHNSHNSHKSVAHKATDKPKPARHDTGDDAT